MAIRRSMLLVAMFCAVGSTYLRAQDLKPDAESAWTRIPVSHSGMLGLPVEINGVKGCLMFDTGAVETLIRDTAAEQIGAKLKDSTEKRVGIGGQTKTKVGEISTQVLLCGKDSFPTLSGTHRFLPLAIDEVLPGSGPIFGVIGLSDLASAGVVVDCGGEQMMLQPNGGFHGPNDRHEIQMIRMTYGENAFLWAVPVKIGDKRGAMIVDTAAQVTVLEKEFASSAGIELKAGNIRASGAGSASATMTHGFAPSLLLSDKLDLGRISVVGVDMAELRGSCKDASGEKLPVAGLLGMDQLRRTKSCIDCSGGKLYLTRQALAVAPEAVFDPELVSQALDALAKSGDQEAKDALEGAAAKGGHLEITPEQGGRFVARAKEKGLLKSDAGKTKGESESAPVTDAHLLLKALQRLTKNGDEEAKKVLEGAVANGGRLQMSSTEAGKFVARAKEKGLRTGDDAQDGNGATDPQLIVKAIQQLAQSGDEDAKKALAEAVANGGRLEITPEKGGEFIARAKEKGLLKEAEGKAGADAQLLLKAIQQLAKNGDEEANQAMGEALLNGGRLEVTPEQSGKFIARAKEKGLLEADEKGEN